MLTKQLEEATAAVTELSLVKPIALNFSYHDQQVQAPPVLLEPNSPAQIKIDVVPELPAPSSPKLYGIDGPTMPRIENRTTEEQPDGTIELRFIETRRLELYASIRLNIYHLIYHDKRFWAFLDEALEPNLPLISKTSIKQLSGGVNLSATGVAKAMRFSQPETFEEDDVAQKISNQMSSGGA